MYTYRAYTLNDVDEVTLLYNAKMGVNPNVFLIRPEFKVSGSRIGVIRSPKYGAAGMILATHTLTDLEINELRSDEIFIINETENILEDESFIKDELELIIPKTNKDIVIKNKKGSGKCPHCQQEISDFNFLGWWYGWERGITPPYWEDLRLFVFKRDKFHCQKCKKLFRGDDLVAHHIIPKEEGGADSARNLSTLCHQCHMDEHPIYLEE
jgi:hypothetical protein